MPYLLRLRSSVARLPPSFSATMFVVLLQGPMSTEWPVRSNGLYSQIFCPEKTENFTVCVVCFMAYMSSGLYRNRKSRRVRNFFVSESDRHCRFSTIPTGSCQFPSEENLGAQNFNLKQISLAQIDEKFLTKNN